MKNLFGITNINVKVIESTGTNTTELNEFLKEYDGNIINIHTSAVGDYLKFTIIYKFKED